MRLIDADEYEISLHVSYNDDGEQEVNADEVFLKLHDAPTIDAVPVVRCKDCKYGMEEWMGWECYHPCDRTRGGSDGNWFCADGERRSDGRAEE